MILEISKYLVILFGIFLILMALLMLFAPLKAREILTKAGSTPFINYMELSIRMIPAIGLIVCAEISKFPQLFNALGWFMLFTSLILFFVPRRIHHNFALQSAGILKPILIQVISPFSLAFGVWIIFSIC